MCTVETGRAGCGWRQVAPAVSSSLQVSRPAHLFNSPAAVHCVMCHVTNLVVVAVVSEVAQVLFNMLTLKHKIGTSLRDARVLATNVTSVQYEGTSRRGPHGSAQRQCLQFIEKQNRT